MDEIVIVIMLKDKSTGFLEKELTTCNVNHMMDKYLLNAYASLEEDGVYIHLKLTADGEFSDEEFNEIFDSYDTDIYKDAACYEVEDCINPTWELVFGYDEQTIEHMIEKFLLLHENELSEVFRLMLERTGN